MDNTRRSMDGGERMISCVCNGEHICTECLALIDENLKCKCDFCKEEK